MNQRVGPGDVGGDHDIRERVALGRPQLRDMVGDDRGGVLGVAEGHPEGVERHQRRKVRQVKVAVVGEPLASGQSGEGTDRR